MKLSPIVKFSVKIVVMAGVNEVLGNLIRTSTPIDIKPIRQIMINIGRIAIADSVSGIIADRVVQDIDEVLEAVTFSPSKEAVKGYTEEELRESIGKTWKDIKSKIDEKKGTLKGTSTDELGQTIEDVRNAMTKVEGEDNDRT